MALGCFKKSETMNALHPYIPVVAAGLVLIGASTIGPDPMVMEPVAVPVSPATTLTFSGDQTAQDNSELSLAATLGLAWKPVFRSHSDHDRFQHFPCVTAARDRSPVDTSDNHDKRSAMVKQSAMLSRVVRLETAVGHGVRVRDKLGPPQAMQRMMRCRAASAV